MCVMNESSWVRQKVGLILGKSIRMGILERHRIDFVVVKNQEHVYTIV